MADGVERIKNPRAVVVVDWDERRGWRARCGDCGWEYPPGEWSATLASGVVTVVRVPSAREVCYQAGLDHVEEGCEYELWKAAKQL